MKPKFVDNTIGEKSAKKHAETSAAHGTAEQPPPKGIVKVGMVLLKVQPRVVGPAVPRGVSEACGQEQREHSSVEERF